MLDEAVEKALTEVKLWDDLKDRLDQKATTLQLEQQQKLCIARLLPLKPSVILMDEPCSALDVEGTRAIEELMFELRGRYSILIVTHNMAQARRASDECIFMLLGEMVEHSRTEDLSSIPKTPKPLSISKDATVESASSSARGFRRILRASTTAWALRCRRVIHVFVKICSISWSLSSVM